jgi:putative membrane protein
MRRRQILCWCGKSAVALSAISAVGGLTAEAAFAADTGYSAADHTFIMKVSQGGMFEVAAGAVAEQKAGEQNIADIGNTEVHDHTLVGDKLHAIATQLGISYPMALNATFQTKIDHLNSLSGKAFDDAFIREMEAIHAADGAAFAHEAKAGQNPMLRRFAAETVLIVRRHIGELEALPLPTM